MLQMVAHELTADRSQCLVHGRDLRHDVGAIAIVVDHFLQPAHLTFDATQPSHIARFDLRIDGYRMAVLAGVVVRGACTRYNCRSRIVRVDASLVCDWIPHGCHLAQDTNTPLTTRRDDIAAVEDCSTRR
jgi:hypothetical protein